jgi:NAD(P)-dependent dehydrogenase (short-subunit alcohol dehydrogenase family)
MNQIDLRDQVAVITGGCGGIGLATAQRMLASGARVALWDLSAESLAATRARLDGVRTYAVDITSEAAVADAAARTLADFGRIDILVNSAGIGNLRSPVADYPADAWRKIVDVNLTGTFLCCKAVVKAMQRNDHGRIVNIASVAAKNGNPFASAYAASKAGVIALTKSLANELVATGVRVNCVVPAAIETELFERMSEESKQGSRSRIPMGRLGKPEEVAAMICWLSSADCSFSNGAAFDLSGGAATY